MIRKSFLAGLVVLALVGALVAVVPSRAVESWTQTLMTTLDTGPATSGNGVLQVNTVNTAHAATSATLAKIVSAPTAGQIYIDGIVLEKVTATTGTVELEYGTGTNCGTGTTAIVTLGPQSSTSLLPLGYYPLHIQVPAGKDLCAVVDNATSTAALVLAQ